MHDGRDALFCENARQQGRIGNVAFVKRHIVGHGKGKARRQIVDHRHRPTGIAQGKDRVTADISGSAGHQDGHFSNVVHGARS